MAAQPAAAQTVETLPPVVVTATRTERSLADQPDSVTVVTRQQIQETPTQSLDDVLRTIPSVDLPLTASYQNHPTASSVSMRGLGGIRALVLLDGVPINDPFFGYIQWNRVPMENVERVAVVRGGGSPLWGNYAMGGVINIIMRVPDQKDIGLEAGGGNYGTYRSNSYGDLVLSDSLKARINVNGWGTAGFLQVPPGSGPIYVPTTFGAVNTQFSTYFTPDPTLRGYLRVNYHYNDQILLTPLSDNNQRIYDFAGSATKTFGPSNLTLTAFHENSRFITDNTNTPTGVATGFGEFLQNLHTTPVEMTGASAQWTSRINDTFPLLSVGSDFQRIHGSDSAAIFDETGAQLRTDVGGGSQRFIGVFGEADIFPIPELRAHDRGVSKQIELIKGVTPAQQAAGRGFYRPVSENCAGRCSDEAIGNLVDCPILQNILGFDPRIIRPDDGHHGHEDTDHIQRGGDYSDPRDIAGEYNDSLQIEIPEHRPSPFWQRSVAARRTGTSLAKPSDCSLGTSRRRN